MRLSLELHDGLKALISFYGLSSEASKELRRVAEEARRRPWYEYRSLLSEGFQSYLGYEASASVIRNFEALFIPGLLQTEEYAHVALQQSVVQEKEELLDLRMKRQETHLQQVSALDHVSISKPSGKSKRLRRSSHRHWRNSSATPMSDPERSRPPSRTAAPRPR
jgi:hypothetical protein